MTQHEQQRVFMERVFGQVAESGLHFCVWAGPPARRSHWCRTAEDGIAAVGQIGADLDIYAGPGLVREDPGPARRVSIESCAGLVALVADVDIAGDGHKTAKRYPRDEDAARELVDAFPLDPSLVIHSGNGLHLWWILEEPWVFADGDEHDAAVRALYAWGAALAAAAEEIGYQLDSLPDLARVLRVPGTWNCKDPARRKPVRLLEQSDARYSMEEFAEWTPAGWTYQAPLPASSPQNPQAPPADLAEIHTRLTGLMAEDSELAGAWERTLTWDRGDGRTPDYSMSGYALSLASRLAIRHGWTESELSGAVQLFYAAQMRPGDHPLNPSKLTKTVAGALRAGAQVTARRTEEAEERWAGYGAAESAPAGNDAMPSGDGAESVPGGDWWDGLEGDGSAPGGDTPDGPATEAAAEQAEAIEALIAQVAAEHDPGPVFAAVPLLADVPLGVYAAAKARLREILGERLNLRDLQSAVTELREQIAKAKRAVERADDVERRRMANASLKARALERYNNGLPNIVVGKQLRDTLDEALTALMAANDPPVLYVRDGRVVRVMSDEHGRPILADISSDALRGRLAAVANWMREHKDNLRDVSPPDDVTRTLLALPEHPFPCLEVVLEHPILRPDGTVHVEPGYDPVTRSYYVADPHMSMPAIPDEPTPDQVQAAAGTIWSTIEEFPFADSAGMANAIGMMLTPLARTAINGPVPMAAISAPSPGSGKSLLAEVVALIATGRPAGMFPPPTQKDEWGKAILAKLLQGQECICLDNVEFPLSNDYLCSTITSTYVEDRLLGYSQIVRAPQRSCWMVTGNNLKCPGDMARRVYWIRLDAQVAQPWRRTEYAIPDLRRHCREQRGELLAALYTLLRAWYVAGCPEPSCDAMGSFEDWQRVIGGTLANAGLGGFLANMDLMYETGDTEGVAWEAFLATWLSVTREPVTCKALVTLADQHEALGEVVPDRVLENGKINTRRLGKGLEKIESARYGAQGLHVERVGTAQRSIRWQVLSDEPLPAQDDAGEPCDPFVPVAQTLDM